MTIPALLFLLQLATSILAVRWISVEFQLGGRIVALHALLVAGLTLAVLGAVVELLSSPRLRSRPVWRRALALAPTVQFALLLLLYLGDTASQSLWGRNLTSSMVAENLLTITTGQQRWPEFPQKPVWVALAGLIIGTALHLRLSRRLAHSGSEPNPAGSPPAVRPGIARAAMATGFLLVSLTVAVLLTQQHRAGGYKLLRYEPLASFFLWSLQSPLRPLPEAMAVAASPAPGSSSANIARPNVVIVMLDAVRADHLSVYGYARPTTPFLDRMVQSGRFRKVETALSTCAETNCGVRSTLTSRTDVAQIHYGLHDALRDQGYRRYVLLSGNHNWYGAKEYYQEVPDLLFDGTNSTRHEVNDDEVLFEGLNLVPRWTGQPAFFYIHVLAAHEYGAKDPRFSTYLPSRAIWEDLTAPMDKERITNGYDNGIEQADATIERLVAELESKGYLQRSVVFVLADHGQGLGERGDEWHAYGHIRSLYQEQIRIPLLIGDNPGIVYRNLTYATQLDIAPTIMERLGLEIPAAWQGRSLLQPDAERYSFHRTTRGEPTRAVVHHTAALTHKYIRTPDGRQELYELNSDPAEKYNLMGTAAPTLISELSRRLDDHVAGLRGVPED